MTQDNLRDVIGLRMQLASEILELAEEHRDEVWARLRSRISGLDGDPDTGAETPQPPPPGLDGPERRRRPAEPKYADEEPGPGKLLGWQRPNLIFVGGAALIAVAVAAAIALI